MPSINSDFGTNARTFSAKEPPPGRLGSVSQRHQTSTALASPGLDRYETPRGRIDAPATPIQRPWGPPVPSGAIRERILSWSGGWAASRAMRTCTIERGASRARSRVRRPSTLAMPRSARPAWRAGMALRPACLALSCLIRSHLRPSAMRSSSTVVWWRYGSPCGVRPVSTSSHSARSAAGSCRNLSQRSAPA